MNNTTEKQTLRQRLLSLWRGRFLPFWNNRFLPFFVEHRFLLWCMLVPAVIVFLIYLVRGLHPIADGCVLVLDLNGQYVWFFEALRNFVHGDADLLYSFSRALGGEFLGIYAYYLASPLSYLVCLFPEDRMLEALLFLFLVKSALCGGTFGYYMYKTMKDPNKLSIILFSACYALSAYAIVQQHNTMWIDAVMWLPLVTLGIESVIKHGRFKLYVISLAVTLFSNYYIGYMVCLWCLIYFFTYYLAHTKEIRNPLGERYHFWRSLLRMALYSLLAIGMAAVILLAAYYSLNFGKTTFSDPEWLIETKFTLLEFFYKLLPGSYDTVRPEGLPFVYCGMLTLLLLPSYFLSKKYPIRQKILSVVLLGVLYLSASLSITDLIWHGFQEPNWLNYRYSFMFCFYLCVLACRAFADFEAVSIKVTMGMGGLIIVLCMILQNYSNGEYIEPKDFTCIYLSLVLVVVYLAVLAFWKKTVNLRRARAAVCIVVAVELFINGLICICMLDMDVGYSRYSYYNDFLSMTRPIVEEVQESDDSFYRMEKTLFRKTNDNMALSMRGLSGSTSTLNMETIQLLNKMGYASKSHWSKYIGGTPVNDSLLGLKYIISDNTVYLDYYEIYRTDAASGLITYRNPYALSVAYGVSDDVLGFEMGFVDTGKADENNKNNADVDEDGNIQIEVGGISTVVDAVKAKVNAFLGIEENAGDTYVDHYNSPFERLNAMVTAMLGDEGTARIFLPIAHSTQTSGVSKNSYAGGEHGYLRQSNTADGTVTYTLTVPADGEIYFNAPTGYPREVDLTLSVNGGKEEDFGTFNGNESQCILSLGHRKAGDTLSLKMTLTEDAVYMKTDESYFYYIDWSAFEDAMGRLASDQYEITEYTEHSFKGSLTTSRADELVLTTIAYDNGWEVYVDGERVEIEKAFGALIAFRVDGEADTHTVEMVYAPRAVNVGLIISIVSVLIFIGLIVLDHFFKLGCRPRRTALQTVAEHEDAAPHEAVTGNGPEAPDPPQEEHTQEQTNRKDP